MFPRAQCVFPSVLPFECSVANIEKHSLLEHLYDRERAGSLWICMLLPEYIILSAPRELLVPTVFA